MRYGREPEVLKDVGFSLPRGSFHFLMGASGSGKSTLLKLIYLAERASRGRVELFGRDVAQVKPKDRPFLRRRIGGDVLSIGTDDPEGLASKIARRFGDRPALLGGELRLERPDGHVFLRQLVEAFPEEILGVSMSRPTLEDVFIHETGHRFWGDE